MLKRNVKKIDILEKIYRGKMQNYQDWEWTDKEKNKIENKIRKEILCNCKEAGGYYNEGIFHLFHFNNCKTQKVKRKK